ncbi:hypothetical protein [Mycobacteroides chelonae]|uniref:hypothetical protein n=1 Tax=Mycobacteroides chelonae TaxID=1774 RepID=UPI0009937BB7|nr:hypothetical protein [Mycobacteroides chelonae]
MTTKPMRLENWPGEDLEVYCAGPFLTTDRQTATKQWLEMSRNVPDEEQEAREKALRGLVASTTTLREQQAIFTNYQGTDRLDSEPEHRVRRKLYGGKKTLDSAANTMAPGTWHVAKSWKDEKSLSDEILGRQVIENERWSEAPTLCANHGNPVAPDRRKYCSDECAREGANAAKRALHRKKSGRQKWPIDEQGWYVQAPPLNRRQHPKVHKYSVYAVERTQTLSKDVRLRPPWGGTVSKRWLIGKRENGWTDERMLSIPNVWQITYLGRRLAC